jgi:hypothetical protein
MLKNLNGLGAEQACEPQRHEDKSFTRSSVSSRPDYSGQPHSIEARQVRHAKVSPASGQSIPNSRPNTQNQVPVSVLRKALPMRFARMQAATSDEFVFH